MVNCKGFKLMTSDIFGKNINSWKGEWLFHNTVWFLLANAVVWLLPCCTTLWSCHNVEQFQRDAWMMLAFWVVLRTGEINADCYNCIYEFGLLLRKLLLNLVETTKHITPNGLDTALISREWVHWHSQILNAKELVTRERNKNLQETIALSIVWLVYLFSCHYS